jgi:ElaB/YqjD/DUF883 family membrane-anchored ribosome-binding protein
MSDSLPTDVLEQRAAEQRRRIHASVSELRSTVRERLDVRRNAEDYGRQHLPQAVAAAGVFGLALGWIVGGAFD